MISIDFESEYDKDFSIKIQGVHRYVEDDRFNPYMVSVYGHSGNGLIKYVGPVKGFDWNTISGQTICAHNVGFDGLVFDRCKGMGLIPETCIPGRWFCTADMSVYLSAPRALAKSAKVMLGMEMDKSTRSKMHGLTYEKAIANGMEKELNEYVIQDAKGCYELAVKYGDRWPAGEQEIARINRVRGDHGINVDQELLDESIQKLEQIQWEAAQDVPWEWDEEKTPLSPTALKLECRKHDLWIPSSFAQDSEECMKWEEEFANSYPWIKAIRNWRRANVLLKRLYAIRIRLRPDGIMPFRIKYFGAHTGRFSGDGGFNMQNMNSKSFMGVDLRPIFIARPGKTFLILDYNQIEARILLHRAGDRNTIAKIREGFGVYEAHARETMGWAGGDLKTENNQHYRLAKARVLGLGFGCGGPTFRKLAKKQANLDLTLAECKATVADYRINNMRICAFWRGHDTAFHMSASEKDPTHEVELLSGRCLEYFNPQFTTEGKKAQKERGGTMYKFWGGLLTENEIQAIARDVLVDAYVRTADAGAPALLHVHDELMWELDKSSAESDAKEIVEMVLDTPEWLGDCPINVEYEFSDFYCKS